MVYKSGISLHVSTPPSWGFARTYIDETVPGHLGGDLDFVPMDVGSQFAIHFRLCEEHEFSCDTIGFLLLKDGEQLAFHSMRTVSQQHECRVMEKKDHILGERTTPPFYFTFGGESWESTLELRVFRMHAPGGGAGEGAIKKWERKLLSAGQVVTRDSVIGGSGIQFIVDDDVEKLQRAHFIDDHDNPVINIKLKLMTPGLLERLCVLTQEPDGSSLKLLPEQIKHLPKTANIEICSHGLTLEQLDERAHQHLDCIKAESLTTEEKRALSNIYLNRYDIDFDQGNYEEFSRFAEWQLKNELHARLNSMTWATLAHRYTNGPQEHAGGYATAAKIIAEEQVYSREDFIKGRMWSIETMISDMRHRSVSRISERSFAIASKLDDTELRAIWGERYPDRDIVTASIKEVIEWVAKKFVEEEFLMAKAQVVAVLGEKTNLGIMAQSEKLMVLPIRQR